MRTMFSKHTGTALLALLLPLSAHAIAPPVARSTGSEGHATEAVAAPLPGVTITLASTSIIPEAQAATPRPPDSLTAVQKNTSEGTGPSAAEETAGSVAMYVGGLAIALLIVRRRLQWANRRDRTITVAHGRHAPPERATSPFGPPQSHNDNPTDR